VRAGSSRRAAVGWSFGSAVRSTIVRARRSRRTAVGWSFGSAVCPTVVDARRSRSAAIGNAFRSGIGRFLIKHGQFPLDKIANKTIEVFDPEPDCPRR
jgi:alpha/beta superfamily hydrolase